MSLSCPRKMDDWDESPILVLRIEIVDVEAVLWVHQQVDQQRKHEQPKYTILNLFTNEESKVTCFMHESKTGLEHKLAAPTLSQWITGCWGWATPSSVRSEKIHQSSTAIAATKRYSTSVEERATVRCFLELQEIGLWPRCTRYALEDVKSSLLPA